MGLFDVVLLLYCVVLLRFVIKFVFFLGVVCWWLIVILIIFDVGLMVEKLVKTMVFCFVDIIILLRIDLVGFISVFVMVVIDGLVNLGICIILVVDFFS